MFLAVLHSFTVCGDRDLEVPSDGNFHPIRRSPALPHSLPPGFHWDGAGVSVFIQPLSFLDLWGERGVNFFFYPFQGEFPAASVGLSTLSPAPPGQDLPLASPWVGCDGILRAALVWSLPSH